MARCECWYPYPNPNMKRENRWRCVDEYECIHDLEKRVGKTGKERLVKTKCEKKTRKERGY